MKDRSSTASLGERNSVRSTPYRKREVRSDGEMTEYQQGNPKRRQEENMRAHPSSSFCQGIDAGALSLESTLGADRSCRITVYSWETLGSRAKELAELP